MLVMDDGWFGHRNNDDSSLGDWKVNTDKIKGGLKYLVDEVNKIGLEFGIWFEPEMISPDSELYRAHPEWAIRIEGTESSTQSRQPVCARSYHESGGKRLCIRIRWQRSFSSARIADVKWDMNRQLRRPWQQLSVSRFAAGRAVPSRYVLGPIYELQERLDHGVSRSATGKLLRRRCKILTPGMLILLVRRSGAQMIQMQLSVCLFRRELH